MNVGIESFIKQELPVIYNTRRLLLRRGSKGCPFEIVTANCLRPSAPRRIILLLLRVPVGRPTVLQNHHQLHTKGYTTGPACNCAFNGSPLFIASMLLVHRSTGGCTPDHEALQTCISGVTMTTMCHQDTNKRIVGLSVSFSKAQSSPSSRVPASRLLLFVVVSHLQSPSPLLALCLSGIAFVHLFPLLADAYPPRPQLRA